MNPPRNSWMDQSNQSSEGLELTSAFLAKAGVNRTFLPICMWFNNLTICSISSNASVKRLLVWALAEAKINSSFVRTSWYSPDGVSHNSPSTVRRHTSDAASFERVHDMSGHTRNTSKYRFGLVQSDSDPDGLAGVEHLSSRALWDETQDQA